MVQIRLNEVVRSIFYAPMYVAINKGFFEEEGLSIELSTGQGADKTMQQVLSGSADIGFCGPEQVIYLYNQGREDHAVVFAQLTKRDGSFLVGRKRKKILKWENLRGKTVIGGRPGGVPEMSLEYVLKEHGMVPNEDVELITNLALQRLPVRLNRNREIMSHCLNRQRACFKKKAPAISLLIWGNIGKWHILAFCYEIIYRTKSRNHTEVYKCDL